ncbi:hypothetical protein ACFW35_13395 [Fictibacillus sp. NPDC058756]|uniref:hypothetical protein n=1 Tax=Fictibacillus sp. NPDC058756 TaxID=3346625 RepID=UPI0036ABD03A
MKDYFIRFIFSIMIMIIIYGVFYVFGLHGESWAAFIILPIGIAVGHGSLYFYKTIKETKQKQLR